MEKIFGNTVLTTTLLEIVRIMKNTCVISMKIRCVGIMTNCIRKNRNALSRIQ